MILVGIVGCYECNVCEGEIILMLDITFVLQKYFHYFAFVEEKENKHSFI